MALVAEQFEAIPSGSSNTGSLVEAAKQATKALKCVAFTTKQIGEMLGRKHERIMKRIGSISEEIESLKADVMENINHQRDRRVQLTEIEEDIERAQLLGNSAFLETLYEELHVMKEETKREETLYRALCKTVRSRKETKKQFMQERLRVEEEIRTFSQKQKLIQTLLANCSMQTSGDETSSASQSDCGASVLEDSEDEDDGNDSKDGASSSSSDSFPENPLDSPSFKPAEPSARREKMLAKTVSLMEGPSSPRPTLRVRSWSSECVQPLHRDSVQNRPRHSLSVHFASPVLTVSTIQSKEDELDKELESLDLTHYLTSIEETSATPSPAKDDDVKPEAQQVNETQTTPVEATTESVVETPAAETASVPETATPAAVSATDVTFAV